MNTTIPHPAASSDYDEAMSRAADLIPIREAAYQRWVEAQRDRDPFPVSTVPPDVVNRAFTEGFMACYGDYRDIILASREE